MKRNDRFDSIALRAAIKAALGAALGLAASGNLMAQDAAAPADDIDEVVVTGTRAAGRTRLDSLAPVDVLSSTALQSTATTELAEALSTAAPSLDFPRPSITDGTDHIRPATLRGLAPDQTLVLVNSKRRHQSALVNVNGSIGRGSAAVDLNAIPMAAIESVEVLRDGASAQYGSDAIAGVINLRLRDAREGGGATAMYGIYDTRVTTSRGSRDANDGLTESVAAWQGLPIGDKGFLTAALEYKDQSRTERGGWDFRQQYPLVSGAFDPREATFNRFDAWYGEPRIDQKTVFLDAGLALPGSGDERSAGSRCERLRMGGEPGESCGSCNGEFSGDIHG